jgi:hypothetical protein
MTKLTTILCNVVATTPLIVLAACAVASDADGDELDKMDQVIFPDEEGPPSESCDLGLSLTCPSQSNTLQHATSFITGTRRTTSFNRSVAAEISSDSLDMMCRATSDYVVTGIVSLGANVPAGISVTPRSDGKGVVFSSTFNALNLVPPDASGVYGTEICGIACSPDATISGCDGPRFASGTFTGQLSVNGGPPRDVELVGSLDTYHHDPKTGVFSMTCKLTLPKSRIATYQDRADDVISASGDRFVRGYELGGTSLTNACRNIGLGLCTPKTTDNNGGIDWQAVELCADAVQAECVGDFSQDDPCNPTCQAPCASEFDCGSHEDCSLGCCRASPH